MTLRAVCLGVVLVACGGAPTPEPEGAAPVDPVANVRASELYEQGLALAERGDLVRAEQYLGAAMQQGYPERVAIARIVDVCVLASRFRVALAYADPYLERNPGDWSLRFVVATVLEGIGDAVRAERELRRVIEQAPDVAAPRFALGRMLADRDPASPEAEAHFRRYLELEPQGRHAFEVQERLRPRGDAGTIATDAGLQGDAS